MEVNKFGSDSENVSLRVWLLEREELRFAVEEDGEHVNRMRRIVTMYAVL